MMEPRPKRRLAKANIYFDEFSNIVKMDADAAIPFIPKNRYKRNSYSVLIPEKLIIQSHKVNEWQQTISSLPHCNIKPTTQRNIKTIKKDYFHIFDFGIANRNIKIKENDDSEMKIFISNWTILFSKGGKIDAAKLKNRYSGIL